MSPIDDRHRLAGIVDKHLVAGDVVLAHRRRQAVLEIAVELAEAAVAVPVGMSSAVLLPQHRQIDARPLHLAGQRCPVRLRPPARSRLGAARGKQPLIENRVGQVVRQWPSQVRCRGSRQIFLNGTPAYPELARNRPCARPRSVMQSQQLAYPSHGQPLCWHLLPPPVDRGSRRAVDADPRGTSPVPSKAATTLAYPARWPASYRNGGRFQIGIVAAFKSERWPPSSRKRWPPSVGICMRAHNRFTILS